VTVRGYTRLCGDSIALWCATERLERFPNATAIMIEADCGGSNSVRARAWKWYLQEKVADQFSIAVTVCHYPTGTSKWNPIEHRLFSEISKTWAGCPLLTFEIAAEHIRSTKTKTGLTVRVHHNKKEYVTGGKSLINNWHPSISCIMMFVRSGTTPFTLALLT
jgi:hypothetical protein